MEKILYTGRTAIYPSDRVKQFEEKRKYFTVVRRGRHLLRKTVCFFSTKQLYYWQIHKRFKIFSGRKGCAVVMEILDFMLQANAS